MKYYTMVNEDGEYSGITTVKSDRMRYTDVPVKPTTGDEKAVFNFDTNKWEYEFESHKMKREDSIYSIINSIPANLYTDNIIPLNGSLVLEKSTDITVLIPCYGKAKYIEEAVKSCINQTMKPVSIIVLLMDDESIAMKEELESLDTIVTCIVSERLNACASRTKLVNECCQTDWFILLDADDTLKENFIEETYKVEGSVIVPRKQFMAEDGSTTNYDDIFARQMYLYGNPFNFVFNNLTSLMNKEVFNSIGLDEELCNGGEDFDFVIRLFEQRKYKVAVASNTCYNYRQCDGLSNLDAFYKSHLKAVVKNIEFLHSEYVAYRGYDKFEDLFYHNPTVETYVSFQNYELANIVLDKDTLIKYKLSMSKKRTPLASYSKDQFIVIGDREIPDFMYANKTFDVVFLTELSFYNIFDDNGIDMVINKDILPEIEELKGYDLLVYLLDNYACFIENNESERRTNEEIKEQLYKSAEHNDLLKKQIEVAEAKTKVYSSREEYTTPLNINFTLHRECNLSCSYCNLGCNRRVNTMSDDEMFERFDKALTYIEDNLKGYSLTIGILGGEPTLWTEYFINKVLDRLKNYRKINLFSNGTNRDSIWYKQDNVCIIEHYVDWKTNPERLNLNNVPINSSQIVVVTHNEVEDVDKVLNVIDNKNIIFSHCNGSPNVEEDLTYEDLDRLYKILDSHNVNVRDNCITGSSVAVDLNEELPFRVCCKGSSVTTIEEGVGILNRTVKVDYDAICKNCKLYRSNHLELKIN